MNSKPCNSLRRRFPLYYLSPFPVLWLNNCFNYSHLHVARKDTHSFFSFTCLITIKFTLLLLLLLLLLHILHLLHLLLLFLILNSPTHQNSLSHLPYQSVYLNQLPCLSIAQSPQSLPTKQPITPPPRPQATDSTSLLQVLQPSELSVCLPWTSSLSLPDKAEGLGLGE